MKTYLKPIFLVALLMALSSFAKLKNDANQKILMSKLYVNKTFKDELKETFLLYDNGSYSYAIQKGTQSQAPFTGKLTKTQFFKIKKLLNRSNIKYLDNKYDCGNTTANAGDFLFSISMPAVKKRVLIHEGCAMPKGLRELDNMVNEIIKE